ncbi:TetR family transcriptional regulator [Streptomyces sp. NPDC002265]|uniref:TetR/AcrR family transcriptional regulator n=1 Tax=Streptomyces sp. NPDC002265 TaxID=3154415 RepID=UPI003327A5DE
MHEVSAAERSALLDRAARRPTLGERRKSALRVEIAHAAIRLFTAQGVAGTTGEEIAQAVGISARTLWRHFPTKESCVRPLLIEGLDVVAEALRAWPADTSLRDYLDDVRAWSDAFAPQEAVWELISLTRTDPGLHAVWLQVHDDALPVFAELFARRDGSSPDSLRVKVHAAMFNGALRAAVEDCLTVPAGIRSDAGLNTSLRTALRAAAEGLPY